MRLKYVGPSHVVKQGETQTETESTETEKRDRVFSGHLSLVKRELITVYVEGIGTAPKDHLATFKAFVSGLNRK